MGEYTEFVFAATLVEDMDVDIIEKIEQFVYNKLKKGSSSFPVTKADNKLNRLSYNGQYKEWTVTIRCSLKDQAVIHQFIDFIKPYVKSGSGEKDFLGYYIHEYWDEPELIYL